MKKILFILLAFPLLASGQCNYSFGGGHLSLFEDVGYWAFKPVGPGAIVLDLGPHASGYDPLWNLDPCKQYVIGGFKGMPPINLDSLVCIDTIQQPCCFTSDIETPANAPFDNAFYTLSIADCPDGTAYSWSETGGSWPIDPPFNIDYGLGAEGKMQFITGYDSLYVCIMCYCLPGVPGKRCEWLKP